MAKTAIVNPRKRRRRRQPEVAENPRRRRRRTYGGFLAPKRRRRRNPEMGDMGARRHYRRRHYRRNPDGLTTGNFGAVMEVLPAATGGVIGARWATHMAGDMEGGKPGFAHALAIWLAAVWGSPLIGNLFGDATKGKIAGIAALGWGGDLFIRKHWLEESDFGKEHLYLGDEEGAGSDELTEEDVAALQGLTQGSAIADYGRSFFSRGMPSRARQFLGAEPQFYQTPDGQIVQLGDYAAAGITPEHAQILADAGYAGLQTGSAIAGLGNFGRRRSDAKSSFGYVSE